MAREIERSTSTCLSNPAKIEVARAATTSETITQGVIMFKGSKKASEASEKQKLLRDIIASEGADCRNGIIFCNRKIDVDAVAKSMTKAGLDASPIHGDLEQSHRMRTLAKFRDGTLRFLVASDVAARGLDIPNVSHVFNYDVPSHAEDYVHRIGRPGRAGKTGTTIMIRTPRRQKNFDDIERLVEMAIPRMELPGMASAAPVATPADVAAPSDDKPKRTRTRGGRDRKTDAEKVAIAPVETARTDTAQQDTPKVEIPAAQAKVVETPKVEQPQAEPKKVEPPKAEPTRDAPRQDHTDNSNRDRSRGGRNRGGRDNHDRGPKVVGMGDDAPTFITLSFDERQDD